VRKSVRTLTCRALGSARERTEPLAQAGAYKKQGAERWQERLQGAQGAEAKFKLPLRKTQW